MGDLSTHFSSSEFACHCGCGEKTVNPELVALLESIRTAVNAPIRIMSGRRCAKHNAKVGGAKNSQHLLGNAADIQVKDMPPHTLHALIEQRFKPGGLGLYKTFVHVDVRSGQARWTG